MALKTRTLTNAGAPLRSPEGVALAGVRVTFTLSYFNAARDVWDAESLERVAGKPVSVTTDAQGEFTVNLWPNSRGNRRTKYLCHVDHPGVMDFAGTINDLDTPLSWAAFMAEGTELTPQEISQLAAYIAQIEAARDAAQDAAAQAEDAVDAAVTAHIAAVDPHPQYTTAAEASAAAPVQSVAGRTGAVTLGKADVGPPYADNTSDADKPISTATQTALDTKVDKVAGKQLSTEDYTAAEKSKLAGVAAGAQVNTVTSVAGKTGGVTLAKADVGLGNVDNTADANKPVSTAQAAANALRVLKAGDTMTGALTLASEAIPLTVNNLPALRPTLLLDFANSRIVDPRISITRASTATRINERGVLETVAAGVPRLDFDPVTLA